MRLSLERKSRRSQQSDCVSFKGTVSPPMCSIMALRHICRLGQNHRDSNWFQIFLCLHWNNMNFSSLFTRCKSREEIELQQGTPQVQKNLQNWQCAANETIRIKNAPTREEASRNSAPKVQRSLVECQIQRCNCRFYICVWHYGSSQAGHTRSSFYIPEVHYI